MNCGACNRKTDAGEVIKCNGCKTGYHYKCVNITTVAFKEGQVKRTFKCDACANVTQRVRVTDDTPVRGSAAVSGHKESIQPFIENLSSLDEVVDKVSRVFMAKISAFESTMIKEIKETVAVLALENSKLRQELKEANIKCNSYENEIERLKSERLIAEKNSHHVDSQSSVPSSSKAPRYAEVAGKSIISRAPAPARVAPATSAPAPLTPRPSVEYATAVARNTADLPDVQLSSEWTKVRRRRKVDHPINRGGNTEIKALKVVERKKYLHVWRLEKSTSEESLKEHVKGVLGVDAEISVEKVKQKTERDYASFRVGVNEGSFDKICNPDMWPLNVEYSEWIWFRRSTKSGLSEPQSQ